MKLLPIGIALFLLCIEARGQNKDVTLLFQNEKPIAIRLNFSIKEVKKITNDTIYTASKLSYQTEDGSWDTLNIGLRARGNFRRANCFFPPLRIKLKKGGGEKGLFAGNKSLKLVVPCQTGARYNDLILKEYLCYQLYEVLTPYIFNTRLVDLTLTDLSAKSPKIHTLKAFLIEDDDLVAKRFKGKVADELKVHPLAIHDTTSVTQAFFQYMIANTDWSSYAQHNVKVLVLEKSKFIPLDYDFDMAGLVDAPYATVSEMLEITSVRDRMYRGFCRDESIVRYVQAEFIRLEPKIMEVVNSFEKDINPKELAVIKKYLEDFYGILKNDKAFKQNILMKCRTK